MLVWKMLWSRPDVARWPSLTDLGTNKPTVDFIDFFGPPAGAPPPHRRSYDTRMVPPGLAAVQQRARERARFPRGELSSPDLAWWKFERWWKEACFWFDTSCRPFHGRFTRSRCASESSSFLPMSKNVRLMGDVRVWCVTSAFSSWLWILCVYCHWN